MGALNPSRRGMLTAIAVGPAAIAAAPLHAPIADRALWDRRRDRFAILKALRDADEAFGRCADGNRAYDLFRRIVRERHGTNDKRRVPAETQAEWDVEFEKMNASDAIFTARFCKPADLAAIELIMTPAPDLDAALLKIEIIKDFELWNTYEVPVDCMDLVSADMARLLGGLN
jgi:hypothetical protein